MLNREKRFIAKILKNGEIYPILISAHTKELAINKINKWSIKYNWELIDFLDYSSWKSSVEGGKIIWKLLVLVTNTVILEIL